MFVRKSKYIEACSQRDAAIRANRTIKTEHQRLLRDWNDLVLRINAKGGEEFLQGRQKQTPPLDMDDIRRLLALCHPDKHGGKQIAQDMTAKLLDLKKQLDCERS